MNNVIRGLLLSIILLLVGVASAQTVGDYRTALGFLEVGTWDDLNDWERWSGGAWVSPNGAQGYPGEFSVPNQVTIIGLDIMTLNVSPANNIGNLTIEDISTLFTSGDPNITINGVLDLGVSIFTFDGTGNLTVSGTSQIDGFFTDSDGTGVSTFVGLVTNTISWTSTSVTASGNLIFRGGIANSGSFAAGGATFNTNDQTLSGTSTISFANAVDVVGVTVTNNGIVTISNSASGTLGGSGTWLQGTGTLNYAGATVGVTTFTASAVSNTVNYNGSVSQTIRNPTASTYYNLITNNTFATSPQLSVTASTIVTNQLTMTSGIVNLSGTTLTLGSSGVASTLSRTASTTTNWMYGGTFTRFWLNATAVSSTAGNLYGLFPVGASTASSYRPVAINSTANPTATGSFSVTHTDASTSTDLSPVYDDAGTNIVRKNDAQFVTSLSGVTGGTYNISVTMTGLAAGTLSDIRLAVSNGATTVTNVGTHSAATGTAPNPTATRTGVTPVGNLVGDFRITTTNSTNTPLPIVLQYFKASVDGEIIKTEWATASETDNDFFTVQKTVDFETYYEVGLIGGQGNSREEHVYSLDDESPFIGKSYYRLKQNDFDGKVSYSNPVMINYEGPTSVFLKAYPNPFNGKKITIELNGYKDRHDVPIQIYNQQGKKLYEIILTEDGPGVLQEEVNFSTPLPMGLYIIKAGKTLQHTRKIVVN